MTCRRAQVEPLTALLSLLGNFWLKNWQFLIGTAIALAGPYFGIKKLK
jgi:hypothetical protein